MFCVLFVHQPQRMGNGYEIVCFQALVCEINEDRDVGNTVYNWLITMFLCAS